MAGIRELVTYLRYKVDQTGLKEYVKEADKAADDVNKKMKTIKAAPMPTSGPNGQKVINLPGIGPGYFDTGDGKKPKFVPLNVPSGVSEGAANFKMPSADQIAIAERQAHRASLRQAEREANEEARAQQQLANAERSARRQTARQAEREARQAAREDERDRRNAARAEASAARMQARQNRQAIEHGQGAIGGAFSGVSGLIGSGLAVLGVHEISKISDEWATVNARIGLVTDNAKEQKEVLGEIYAISNRTRQSYEETANLVFNMRQATEHAGISMKDTLSAAENFNKALIIGGGTAANNRRAIYELNHALEIGKLGGMQLRSLRMEAPIFIRTLSEQLAGGNADKLNEMAKGGLLTTKKIVDALNKATGELNDKFKKMPLTIGQATTVAGNMFGKLVSDIGQSTGAFQDFAHAIVAVTGFAIDSFRGVADAVGGFGNLARLVAIILGSLVTAKVLRGLNAIAEAFKAGGAAAAIAAAPFWALVAVLSLIGVIIEDIYGYLHGKDSLFGKALESVLPFFAKIQEVWHEIEDKLGGAIEKVGMSIDKWFVQPLKEAFDWASKLASSFNFFGGIDSSTEGTPKAQPWAGSRAGNWFRGVGMGMSDALNTDLYTPSVNDDFRRAHNLTVNNNINTSDNPNAIAAAATRGTTQGARAMGNAYPNAEAK